MMMMQAAVVIEQGVTFAVVSVRQEVTNYTYRAIRMRQELQKVFKNMPIILMSMDSNGQPHYYGRRDIVNFLKSIKVSQIPWRQFTFCPV